VEITMDDRRILMTRSWRIFLLVAIAGILSTLGLAGSVIQISRADSEFQQNTPAAADSGGSAPSSNQDRDWQVTVLGILVMPRATGDAFDPRLSNFKNPLRKLIPADHGCMLLDVRSDRLSSGQSLQCDLGKDRLAKVTLLDPLNPDGKVKLRCELTQGKKRLSISEVASPPNQLFFCEHSLGDGSKLLIGVGAR
jgi:hypothetical protein